MTDPRHTQPGSDPERLPRLPGDGSEPVFAEPWEARAFGLVVHLHKQGHFTWQEWSDQLAAEIAAAGTDPEPPYYELWMRAAETLCRAKGLVGDPELNARREEIAANPVPPHGTAQRQAVAVDPGRPRER